MRVESTIKKSDSELKLFAVQLPHARMQHMRLDICKTMRVATQQVEEVQVGLGQSDLIALKKVIILAKSVT